MDGTTIKYRQLTDYCDVCIRTAFEGDCFEDRFVGGWWWLANIEPHKTFKQLLKEQNSNHPKSTIIN